jgi:hypothetical protein
MVVDRQILKPFVALFATIDSSISLLGPGLFDRCDLAAVCIRMSYGSLTWCACNKSDKENLELLATTSGVLGGQFTEFIRCREGALRGNIPKFVFDKQRYEYLFPLLYKKGMSTMEIAFWSCRWGMIGRFLPGWVAQGVEDMSIAEARQVVAAPAAQVLLLKKDLELIAHRNVNSKILAFTRYRSGPVVNVADEWGVRTNDLANELRQRWAEIAPTLDEIKG